GETFSDLAVTASQAFSSRFAEESERLRQDLEEQLLPVVTAAGESAGAGLMTAFASGVTANRAVLLTAVEGVLQDVADRLPQSDAKKGPLSSLTRSGQMLVRTFMGGAERERSRLAGGMSRLLSAARPSSVFTLAAASGAGMTPATINNYFEGAPTAPVPGSMAIQARSFARAAIREAEIQMKLRGRRF